MVKTNKLVWFAMFVLYLLFYPLVTALKANNRFQQQHKAIRHLYGQELYEARQARDAADRLLLEYKRSYLGAVTELPEEKSREFEHTRKSPYEIRDFEEVVSAYEHVTEKYEGTEVAAYCQLRLCEPYKYRGDFLKAIDQAQTVVAHFPGTSYESKAYFTMGNIHLQGLNNAKGAIHYFRKVAKLNASPSKEVVPQDGYNQNHQLYISAQQQIAKCEIRLGNAKTAKEIYDQLAHQYPQFKLHFESILKFELDSYMRGFYGFDLEKIIDDTAWSIPTLLETSQSPQPFPEDSAKPTSSSSPMKTNVPKLNDKSVTKTKKNVKPVLNAENTPSAKAPGCLFSVSRIIMISSIAALVVLFLAFRGLKSGKEVDMVKK